MKMINFFSSCVIVTLLVTVSTSTRAQINMVDYQQALTYIKDYQAREGSNTTALSSRGENVPALVNTAIKEATLSDNYEFGSKYHGTRLAYGKNNNQMVVVLLPLNAQSRAVPPSGNGKVYTVDIAHEFSDPCPPNCD